MLDNFNLEIENKAAYHNGNYIEAVTEYQNEHPEFDFYAIVDLLDPIVKKKVELTYFMQGYFPDKKPGRSLDDIFK